MTDSGPDGTFVMAVAYQANIGQKRWTVVLSSWLNVMVTDKELKHGEVKQSINAFHFHLDDEV